MLGGMGERKLLYRGLGRSHSFLQVELCSTVLSDHVNHKSRHLDRVAYMAIYGVLAFDKLNFDSHP